MKKSGVLKLIIGCLLMTGCSLTKQTVKPYVAGEWTVVTIGGIPVDTTGLTDAPFIGFDREEGRIYGSASCNRFFSGLELDTVQSRMRFGMIGATRMMCPHIELENRMLSALDSVRRYEPTADGRLRLLSEEGRVMLELRRR